MSREDFPLRRYARLATLLGVSLVCWGGAGCARRPEPGTQPETAGVVPPMMAPPGAVAGRSAAVAAPPAIDLSGDRPARGTVQPVVIDTRTFEPQIQVGRDWDGRVHEVEDFLPRHLRHAVAPAGVVNRLPLGGVSPRARTAPGAMFPGLGVGDSGGWMPPDCSLAVGPEHIVTTVNMTIGFYAKDGTLQTAIPLNDRGDPGFFEPAGAGGFTFDPKCLYDHDAQRFVVIAPEVYSDEQTAWIDIAVSDDADPHGIWYLYRTYCVVSVGETTFWLDYPGLGYDHDAIYVTGNLFGLNASGWGGVLFRIFDKAALLAGEPVVYTDLRDGGAVSVQVAHHFGDNPAPYFVSANNGWSLKIHAITNPLTNPTLVSTGVVVPYFAPLSAGAPNVGGTLSTVDSRIFNAHWRNGELYAAHTIRAGGKNMARWYHLRTNGWPDAGAVEYVEGGNINGGTGVHTFFPAVFSNKFGSVALVMGSSTAETTPEVDTTGRVPGDPAGELGALHAEKIGPNGANGRWGDYFDITVDPTNDATFWIMGEYQNGSGWATWISSLSVTDCEGDLNADGVVDLNDLSILLTHYGQTAGALYDDGDFSGDGKVDLTDLSVLLQNYGTSCP